MSTSSKPTTLTISEDQAIAGAAQLKELLSPNEAIPCQTNIFHIKDTLYAGLGPIVPEANARIIEAMNHESRPLPVIFRGKTVDCTDWQGKDHHEVLVQSGA